MKTVWKAAPLAALLVVACQAAPDASADFSGVFDGSAGQWVDLSYAYSDETIYWPTAEPFRLNEEANGETEAGYFYSAYTFSTAEHGGTHLDAPYHFSRDGMPADRIPLSRLIGPAVVVDVSAKATPDYLVTVGDLEAFEAEHGRIPDGAILLIRTGWGDRWPDRAAYLGTDTMGPEAVPELHFPRIHPDAARWILENRSIASLGIDTASIDYGQSTGFETHVIMYGGNVPGFENVANMAELPVTGSFVVALPMKIEGGSGAPLRMAAFVPN